MLILESVLQEPLADEAGNTLLMLSWPTEPARLHRRKDDCRLREESSGWWDSGKAEEEDRREEGEERVAAPKSGERVELVMP